MNKTWIIVASRDEVRVFSRETPSSTLVLEIDIGNATGRLRTGDINSDKAGCSTDNRKRGHHAYSTEEDPRDRLLKDFYRDFLEQVRHAYTEQRFSDLILVAEPRLLGILRSLLPDILEEAVSREVPKDLSFAPVDSLERRLGSGSPH
jgi:protein required for attachment to host cells